MPHNEVGDADSPVRDTAAPDDSSAELAERERKRLKAERREKKRSKRDARAAAAASSPTSNADARAMTDAPDADEGKERRRHREEDGARRRPSERDVERSHDRDRSRGRHRDGRDNAAPLRSPLPDRGERSSNRRDRSRDARAAPEADQRGRDFDRRRGRDSAERGHSRDRGRSRDGGRDRKRERERGEDRARSSERHRDKRRREPDAGERRRRDEAAAAAAVAARDDAAREQEARDLDSEAEKRRKRIEVWQAKQREKDAGPSTAGAGPSSEIQPMGEDAPPASTKKWSFEDEDSDDEEPQPAAADVVAAAGSRLAPPGMAAAAASDDEVDPLDAFMADNNAKAQQDAKAAAARAEAAAAAAAAAADAEGGDEIDPLDAFMAELPTESKPAAAAAVPAAAAAAAAAAAVPAAAAAAAAVAPSPPASAPQAAANGQAAGAAAKKPARRPRRMYDSEESSDEEEEAGSSDEDDEVWAKNVQAGKMSKGDRLGPADHSKIDYPPFRRNFYIEVPEIARMTDEQLAERRKALDGIKVRGKNVPRPVRTWNQCGLSGRVLEALHKAGMTEPMPIQAQALPIIMSGRDCIGVAKTGSGKTLAFVLPMLRHIKDQPPLEMGDGPVSLIMAPTRELVQQIGKDVKRFTKALGIACTCVYGGSGVANQITELKRGTEVVVCTPGRMIDILVTSAGKITNLRRVTYLVMDEADRMFDMGFEPQIMRIVNNIRPDRQTVMFSATFPRSVEVLARAVLQAPVEIQVGGRSVVNSDITQLVEIREEEDRFLRLLEVLGIWYEKGKALVFVQSQDKCDTLFRDLLKSGYPCLSLHGGKDQSDRESTISDFKSNVCNVLVATSVAARGLDVKDLVLVVNFDVPNHHEDYVHRVGRTGRAGAKGTAITFIGPGEERYAPDLVKALRESNAPIPKDLIAMGEDFQTKRKAGLVQGHASGFGGSGFKFDAAEEEDHKNERKGIIKEYGMVEQHDSEDEGDDKDIGVPREMPRPPPTAAEKEEAAEQAAQLAALPAEQRAKVEAARALLAKMTEQSHAEVTNIGGGIRRVVPSAARPMPVPQPSAQSQANKPQIPMNAVIAAAQAAAARLSGGVSGQPPPAASAPPVAMDGFAAAQHAAAELAANPGGEFNPLLPHFETELEINDFPQHARWKITHRETMKGITELTGAAVVTRGVFVERGRQPPEGERKLALLIQGATEAAVKNAKAEVKRILEETTEKAMRYEGAQAGGRYSVMR